MPRVFKNTIVVTFPVGKAFLIGSHVYSYRSGERAEIVAIVNSTSDDQNVVDRPCWMIRFSDGVEDYIPICDAENYKAWFVEMPDAQPTEAVPLIERCQYCGQAHDAPYACPRISEIEFYELGATSRAPGAVKRVVLRDMPTQLVVRGVGDEPFKWGEDKSNE